MGEPGHKGWAKRLAQAVALAEVSLAQLQLSPAELSGPWTLDQMLAHIDIGRVIQGCIEQICTGNHPPILRDPDGRKYARLEIVRSLRLTAEIPLHITIASPDVTLIPVDGLVKGRLTLACMPRGWPAVLRVHAEDLLPTLMPMDRIEACIREFKRLCETAGLQSQQLSRRWTLAELLGLDGVGTQLQHALVRLCDCYTSPYYSRDELDDLRKGNSRRKPPGMDGDDIAARTAEMFLIPKTPEGKDFPDPESTAADQLSPAVPGPNSPLGRSRRRKKPTNWPVARFPDRSGADFYIAMPPLDWPKAFAKYAKLKFCDAIEDAYDRPRKGTDGKRSSEGVRSFTELKLTGGFPANDADNFNDWDDQPWAGDADLFPHLTGEDETRSLPESAFYRLPEHRIPFEQAVRNYLGGDAALAMLAHRAVRGPEWRWGDELDAMHREWGVCPAELFYLGLIVEQFAVAYLELDPDERDQRTQWASMSAAAHKAVPEPKPDTLRSLGMSRDVYKRRVGVAALMNISKVYDQRTFVHFLKLAPVPVEGHPDGQLVPIPGTLGTTISTTVRKIAKVLRSNVLSVPQQLRELKVPYVPLGLHREAPY